MQCQIPNCRKGPMFGHKISHSNIKTKHAQQPNVQKVRAVVNGRHVRLRVCTRCLRSGLVQKVG